MAEMMVFVGAQLRRPRDGHEQWCAERQASRLAFLCVSLRFFAFLCISLRFFDHLRSYEFAFVWFHAML
jgi:hypothetical protein